MFEIIVKLKNDWIDLSGVSDLELCKALSEWSNGSQEFIIIKDFSFRSKDIVNITNKGWTASLFCPDLINIRTAY